MILRRVIAHFRKQEWTAIFIDFVIVVVGVFVGMQVTNWNAARLERSSEREFIEIVRNSISGDAEDIRGYIAFLDDDTKFGARALAALKAAEPCADDCWGVIRDFFLASQWASVKGDTTAFVEVQRTGRPRDAALKSVIMRYYGLQDQLASIVTELPAYRREVRSIIPAAAQEHFWRNCFRVEGRRQVFIEDCPPALNAEESRAVVAALRAKPELEGSLTYWLSTVSVVRTTLAQQADEAEKTVALINDHLARQP
ncbi:MAG: hypothetical protein A3E78_12770 [Alphaproteobacteria bacterium RIFCSPHIGHO2_12_FULL_63_12]|nr:MAG: hypothetical protein A3E78_12770 [Alphaproteobacteria bacterium RIFCSPHIGHO2_12_FULL_63_12]